MSRKRSTEIREDPHDLEELYRDCRKQRCAAKIEMLLLMQREPSLPLSQVAVRLGRSERSVNRWWKEYCERGIKGILDRDWQPMKGLTQREITELRHILASTRIQSLEQVQGIIRSRFDVHLSIKAVSTLLQERLGAYRVWVVPESGVQSPSTQPFSKSIPDKLLHFLNHLPLTGDGREWVAAFRDALHSLLEDVDRITVNVNIDCDLRDPTHYKSSHVVRHHVASPQERTGKRLTYKLKSETVIDPMVEDMGIQGFPVERYHPPVGYEYHLTETAFVGAIILWRERQKKPISPETIALVESLRPYLLFLLTDCIARHQYHDPTERVFNDALLSVTKKVGLTMREREVLVLHLFGYSYKSIAAELHISENTVRKHVRSIHEKTGTRTYRELFASFFTSVNVTAEKP